MEPSLLNTLITAGALAVACALLSLVVILRSWAFIGDGISHAGFGGIGTAWLLSLIFPALGTDTAVYLFAVFFCIAVALGIGAVTRRDRLSGDTAIGIFVVASLAWGFISLAIYQRFGHSPPNWEGYLMGNMTLVPGRTAIAAVCIAAAVVCLLIALRKEILLYCFDPMLAAVSGVRTRLIHYLLMVMLATIIVIGMGLAGNLLIPALLILPGAAALLLSRQLGAAVLLAIGISLIGVLGGCLVTALWPDLPPGATIVLTLVVLLAISAASTVLRRRAM